MKRSLPRSGKRKKKRETEKKVLSSGNVRIFIAEIFLDELFEAGIRIKRIALQEVNFAHRRAELLPN